MKLYKILNINFVALLLALVFTACDSNHGKKPGNAAYMEEAANNKALVSLTAGPDGGVTYVSPRIANLSSSDVTLTIGVDEVALEKFNQLNNALYRPIKAEDVSFILPDGTVVEGLDADYVIKAGEVGSSIGVKIGLLNNEKYPSNEKFAIPVSIKSAAGTKVIDKNKTMIITLNRIVVTSVANMSGGGIVISPYKSFEDADEWTLQVTFNFKNLSRGNLTNTYFSNSAGGEFYTRTSGTTGIQVKNGRDGDDTWTQKALPGRKWLQISYVYRDKELSVYVNGELHKLFKTTKLAPRQSKSITVGNGGYDNDYIREIRFFSKALSETEILENIYQPLSKETPNLEVYIPMTEETGIEDVLDKGTVVEKHNGTRIGWIKNVKFPSDELVIIE